MTDLTGAPFRALMEKLRVIINARRKAGIAAVFLEGCQHFGGRTGYLTPAQAAIIESEWVGFQRADARRHLPPQERGHRGKTVSNARARERGYPSIADLLKNG